jgi:hypothetical protein
VQAGQCDKSLAKENYNRQKRGGYELLSVPAELNIDHRVLANDEYIAV